MGMSRTSSNRVTHYIPPVNWKPFEREFVEPSPSDSFIWWLYRYRCAKCKMPGQEVNEIIPRSRSKKSISDWKNRILLCRNCHQEYHMNGVTDDKINAMREIRITYLEMIGRGEYL
jgi:5-methylcytosine-specific restriction endonuclease McrA